MVSQTLVGPRLHEASHLALFSLILDVLPLIIAVAYAFRPTERRLALMRPVSLAAIFGAVGGVIGGMALTLNNAAGMPTVSIRTFQLLSQGFAEAMVPIYFGFGCLAVAWLLVALGMNRTSD